MLLTGQTPSNPGQHPALPNANSPLASPYNLLNALAGRNPHDPLSLAGLSPSVDLSPAAFALGATNERRNSGFTRPPLTPLQTSPLLSPLFTNVAHQLASPLTPQAPDPGNPLSSFATPQLPASLVSNL
jgi:hypothetical protein